MTVLKALVRREWRANRAALLLSAGLVVVWQLGWAWFAAFRSEVPAEAVSFAVMPLLASFIWALITGLSAVDEEWRRGTANQLLMLPVRGGVIVAAKLLVFVATSGSLIVLVMLGAYGVWLAGGRPLLEVDPLAVPVGGLWQLVIVTVIYMLTVMAATAARTVTKTWGRLVGVGAFVGAIVALRPLRPIAGWLNSAVWPHVRTIDLCVTLQRDVHLSWSTCPVPSPVWPPNILYNSLFIVGLFVLAAYLLERRAEV